MKIAYFTDTYVPQVNGVTFTVQAHAGLLARNHQVRVYAPAYGLMYETVREKNLVVERYPSVPLATYKEIRLPVVDMGRLEKSVIGFDPDIIHFHSPGVLGLAGVRMAKKLDRPLVGTYHTLFSEMLPPLPVFRFIPGGWLRKGIWKLSNKVFERCSLVISLTQTIADELVRHGLKSEVRVLSGGIDIEQFAAKKSYRNRKRILHVGRMSHEKNVEAVVRAFGEVIKVLPDALLVVAGGGPALEGLKKLAGGLGLGEKVTFLGYVSREKLGALYRRSDVFVTASAMETLGLVIVEAMASGLPVVGVAAGGVKDLVREGVNGYLVNPGDYRSMAKKIIHIFREEKLLEKLGKNSRKLAEKHDVRKAVKELEEIYARLRPMDSVPNNQPFLAL